MPRGRTSIIPVLRVCLIPSLLFAVFPTRSFGRRVGRNVVDSHRRFVLYAKTSLFSSFASSHRYRPRSSSLLCPLALNLRHLVGCCFRHLRRVPYILPFLCHDHLHFSPLHRSHPHDHGAIVRCLLLVTLSRPHVACTPTGAGLKPANAASGGGEH